MSTGSRRPSSGDDGALPPGRRRAADRDPKPSPDAEAAFEIAARYLGARPRSRWEVARRLRRAGAGEAVIGATLERLAQLGYVDDLAFARWWAEQRDRHSPRGRRLVESELRQRGIGREVIETLREERGDPTADLEPSTPPEARRAKAALRRHLRGSPIPDDPRARQRLAAFLSRRGFGSDTVWAILRAVDQEDPDS